MPDFRASLAVFLFFSGETLKCDSKKDIIIFIDNSASIYCMSTKFPRYESNQVISRCNKCHKHDLWDVCKGGICSLNGLHAICCVKTLAG